MLRTLITLHSQHGVRVCHWHKLCRTKFKHRDFGSSRCIGECYRELGTKQERPWHFKYPCGCKYEQSLGLRRPKSRCHDKHDTDCAKRAQGKTTPVVRILIAVAVVLSMVGIIVGTCQAQAK